MIDEQMSAVKKGYDFQCRRLRFSKKSCRGAARLSCATSAERLFVYTGLVYTWADSLEELTTSSR